VCWIGLVTLRFVLAILGALIVEKYTEEIACWQLLGSLRASDCANLARKMKALLHTPPDYRSRNVLQVGVGIRKSILAEVYHERHDCPIHVADVRALANMFHLALFSMASTSTHGCFARSFKDGLRGCDKAFFIISWSRAAGLSSKRLAEAGIDVYQAIATGPSGGAAFGRTLLRDDRSSIRMVFRHARLARRCAGSGRSRSFPSSDLCRSVEPSPGGQSQAKKLVGI